MILFLKSNNNNITGDFLLINGMELSDLGENISKKYG